MFARPKIFLRMFARVSPVFAALAFLLLCAVGASATEAPDTGSTSSGKRQAASAQFARAEDLRAALNSKPPENRKLAEYKQVVASYRRVYLITPHATEVPDALLAVAELYAEMGGRFGRSYYQSAFDSYEFLIHEYPKSHFGQDAMLRAARLQREQLGDAEAAKKAYEDFLKEYPRSTRKREAQEALAELALLRNSDQNASAADEDARTGAAKSAAADAGGEKPSRAVAANAEPLAAGPGDAPRIRRISTSANEDSTRVTIDLEDSVQYASARIRNPDRIFFDLHAARLTPEVARGNIRVEGDLLTAVRVAQNQAGVVRVVLDVNGVKDYTASLLNNPPQLVIDLYAYDQAAVRKAKAKRKPPRSVTADETADAEMSSQEKVQSVAARSTKVGPEPADVSESGTGAIGGSVTAGGAPRTGSTLASSGAALSRASRAKSFSAKGTKPDLIRPAPTPQPTRDGQATLTRTLGLKIGRIVIDAGHGGHDTGTIGPTGLMEKDLCLDVALRLGKIIQQRLPGADVVYTRSDDTFIPLEERTRVANEAKADLFISIHANSSQNHSTRGIETYYLNLRGSPDAMEVASRENATSQESVHDLEDLVKKIARSEKIDESREFAADIQESLAKRIQKMNRTVKDRGVRKAPFVVLIGADMPSILTEISFLSNSADEQLLKKPEHRQRVAEGLYQGVASYLQSLNSVTLNLPREAVKSETARPAALASVEQSRNQQ